MKISILCSSDKHPVNSWLIKWIERNKKSHEITLLREKKDLKTGDLLFLVSCGEIIAEKERNLFAKTLVFHASDLPQGRGWSPHIWSIVNGEKKIVVSLLEAEDKLDSGDIWKKVEIEVPVTALFDEINQLLFATELDLMDFALENYSTVQAQKQDSTIVTTYWPKRKPADSEIDINRSIGEQFNILRVSDPDRYPAFFYKDGKKFILKIEVADE